MQRPCPAAGSRTFLKPLQITHVLPAGSVGCQHMPAATYLCGQKSDPGKYRYSTETDEH